MTAIVTIKTEAGTVFSGYPQIINIPANDLWDALSTVFFKVHNNKLNPGDVVTIEIQSPVTQSKTVPKQDTIASK